MSYFHLTLCQSWTSCIAILLSGSVPRFLYPRFFPWQSGRSFFRFGIWNRCRTWALSLISRKIKPTKGGFPCNFFTHSSGLKRRLRFWRHCEKVLVDWGLVRITIGLQLVESWKDPFRLNYPAVLPSHIRAPRERAPFHKRPHCQGVCSALIKFKKRKKKAWLCYE